MGHNDRDLTSVLRRLTEQRKTESAKQRLANHPATRLFLQAGINVLSSDPSHMGAVTKPRILEEAEKLDSRHQPPLDPSDAKFRDRWPYIDDYQADLLYYCLSWQHWSLRIDDVGRFHSKLSREPGFYNAIQTVAYHDLLCVLQDEFNKISFLLSLSASNDPVIKAAVQKTDLDVRRLWRGLCSDVIKQRGLRLRPGLAISELADLLMALADGIAVHILADENCGMIDHDKRESLLGTGAAAIVAGFLDPGDGKSLQRVLDGDTAIDVKYGRTTG